MALTIAESNKIAELYDKLVLRRPEDEKYLQYVQLARKIEQIGMAVPPEVRRFLMPVGWPYVVVDTLTSRQQVRALLLPGEDSADEDLQAVWDANNMQARMKMQRQDRYTFGRSYISVGTNPKGGLPLIRVESPREIEVEIDARAEAMTAAVRFYGYNDLGQGPLYATYYAPDYTKWLAMESGRWVEKAVDHHRLDAVPLVLDLNRQWSGSFEGMSELTEILPLTDGSIRSLTNMQFAQEAHGVPGIWATGVSQGDFVGADGQPLSQFEAYYDVVKMLTDPNAKWGQFSAADLKNFETAMAVYGKQASIVTGFPARYFGLTTANPATEGAIIADEVQLVRKVEDKNESEGTTLGWVMGLAERFRTGRWVEGNRIKIEYHNPATPTMAQREDALAKRRAAGVLSIEGYWDELGWSEARKAKEREYLRREQSDPELAAIADRLMTGERTA